MVGDGIKSILYLILLYALGMAILECFLRNIVNEFWELIIEQDPTIEVMYSNVKFLIMEITMLFLIARLYFHIT